MSRGARPVHTPVLVGPVLRILESSTAAEQGGWIVDGTEGAGGHTAAILERFPRVRVLGLDQDPAMLEHARARLAPFEERVRLVHGRISGLEEHLAEHGIAEPLAILFDLGASSLHLDDPARGFSFQADGPLDMRLDPTRERTAADIVNHWDEADLADLFYHEGGETRSRQIARAILDARRRAPILRTYALAEVVARAVGGARGRIHPATRTFQALRRAVNEEGEELLAGLAGAERVLHAGGCLLVISFHSGEDGAVKRFFAEGAIDGRWDLVTRKPLRPSDEEVSRNRRARSARLRAALRTAETDERWGHIATDATADAPTAWNAGFFGEDERDEDGDDRFPDRDLWEEAAG